MTVDEVNQKFQEFHELNSETEPILVIELYDKSMEFFMELGEFLLQEPVFKAHPSSILIRRKLKETNEMILVIVSIDEISKIEVFAFPEKPSNPE